MKEKITADLLKLEKELSTLDKAVKQISKAEKLSTETVNAVKELHQKFSLGIDNIIKNVETFMGNAQKSVEQNDQNLKELITQHNQQIKEVNKLLKSYLDLATSTATLNKQIGNIDFPARLDKISANIAQMNTEFRTIQSFLKKLNDDDTAQKNAEMLKKISRKAGFTNVFVILIFIIILAIGYDVVFIKHFPQFNFFK